MDNWITWRKHQRASLLARREAIPEEIHHNWSIAISNTLKQGFPILQKMNIGLYWPFRGEYDPRPAANYFKQRGATLALPVIIRKHAPLYFREWWQDAPMRDGAHGIPVPDNTKSIIIDAVIIPMVGFDQQGYRLGYGSGYYDRTLAESNPRPLIIGVAFETLRLDNVYPQPHDIAMHFVVTETRIYQTLNNKLTPISINQCAMENTIK